MKSYLSILFFSLIPLNSARAAIVVSTDNIADNVAWPAVPAFVVSGTSNLYDARALQIQNADSFTIDSVRIILDTTGTFDDSIAMDIDADDVIDFATTQADAYATPGVGSGVYIPWNDASPYTFDAVISQTGTTLASYWNGVMINPGAGGQGFNNASSFTLMDWGFGPGGTIIGNNFTTGEIRLGSINTAGPEDHNIAFSFDAVLITDTDGNIYLFDPDGDGVPANVPEPATSVLIIAVVAILAVAGHRRLNNQ